MDDAQQNRKPSFKATAETKIERVHLQHLQSRGCQTRFDADFELRVIHFQLSQDRRQCVHQDGHAGADANTT